MKLFDLVILLERIDVSVGQRVYNIFSNIVVLDLIIETLTTALGSSVNKMSSSSAKGSVNGSSEGLFFHSLGSRYQAPYLVFLLPVGN